MMPEISVVIPVYRVEPYLDRCVKSVVGQTFSDLEIILVDDGSPDHCPEICDAWAEKDRRIKVIHKANGGLSDARNAGISAASGKYISFVDSDDWIAPEMLRKLYDALHRDNSDIAACTVQMVWEDGTPSKLLTVQTNRVLDNLEAQKALLRESLLKQPVWCKLYRRETIDGILFEVGKQHEDVYWSYQAVGRARRVTLTDYIGYFYFQRGGSIMGAGYSLKRLDAIEAYERRYVFLAEFFPELEKEARLNIVTSCIYHGQMAMKFLPEDQKRQAMRYLNEVKSRHPIIRDDYADRKLTHRLWLDLARVSLPLVCRVKNAVRVGL